MSSLRLSATARSEDRNGDAVKICSHIQPLISGKRIIYAPLDLPFVRKLNRRTLSPTGLTDALTATEEASRQWRVTLLRI